MALRDSAKQARAIVGELGIEGQDHGLTELQCLFIQHVLAEVNDLATLVKRMARMLNDHPLAERALDYLKRHGFESSVLRDNGKSGLKVFDPGE